MSAKSIALAGLNLVHRGAAFLPRCGDFRPVRGAFSAKQLLDSGAMQGRLIAAGQETGPCPPGSMTERADFQQNDHQPWPIFWVKADDARLIGRMLHWRDPNDEICLEGVYGLTRRRRLGEDRLLAQLRVPKPKELPGAWTSITSNWNDGTNYYHWILDGLSRLSLCETMPETPGILLPESLPRFARETLELLGLETGCGTADAPCIHPERYYFCAPTAMTGVRNPHGYDWLRRCFAPHFGAAGSGPPVFLTRRGYARVPANLDDIEKSFSEAGYQIVDCGKIPVRDQIRKVSSAPAVAGLHGAAMTNLLWATRGTPVLEIFQPGYLNACYEQIAFQGGLDYHHLINQGPADRAAIDRWLAESVSREFNIGAVGAPGTLPRRKSC